jgi:hypothetical protein
LLFSHCCSLQAKDSGSNNSYHTQSQNHALLQSQTQSQSQIYSSPSAVKGPSRGQYDTHALADRDMDRDRNRDRDRGRRGEESSEIDEKVSSKLQVRRMSEGRRRDMTREMLSLLCG